MPGLQALLPDDQTTKSETAVLGGFVVREKEISQGAFNTLIKIALIEAMKKLGVDKFKFDAIPTFERDYWDTEIFLLRSACDMAGIYEISVPDLKPVPVTVEVIEPEILAIGPSVDPLN